MTDTPGSDKFKNKAARELMRMEVGELLDELGLRGPNRDFDFIVCTDGSGHHSDKVGGFHTIVIPKYFDLDPVRIYGAKNCTTTPRQEFEALIEGVKEVVFHPTFFQGAKVIWISDCKSLVDSVSGDAKRVANEDLWVTFEWFEKGMNISAFHIPRDNELPFHADCDMHASTLRMMMKAYLAESVT